MASAHMIYTGLDYKMVHILAPGHIKYPAHSLKTGLAWKLARNLNLAHMITVDLINTQTHNLSMDLI
ncbi:MAG: hypothetical protein C0179_03725 [Fervidicoccus sp.]|nr:MAG: hypothetical protein C0179_03725 [Fervidicoccus sp.]